MSKTPFFRRKITLFFIAVLLVGGSLFVARGPLTLATAKWCLKKTLPSSLTYKEITQKEGVVTLTGLDFFDQNYQVTLEEVRLKADYKQIFKSWSFWKERVFHGVQARSSLLQLKPHGLDVEVEKGILKLGQAAYPFRYLQGTLSLFNESSPFLMADFTWQGAQVISQLKVSKISCERILPLVALMCGNELLERCDAHGALELEAVTISDETGALAQLSSRLLLDNFILSDNLKGIEVSAEKLELDLKYPEGIENAGLPLWKQVLCFSSVQEGSISMGKKFSLTHLHGSVELDPREDPLFALTGELSSDHAPLALTLKGKGSTIEHNAYCLDFGLHLEDKVGGACDSFLSLYNTEGGALVVELQADQLRAEQIEMGKRCLAGLVKELEDWEVKQGVFSGKGVALIEKGELTQLEVRNLFAEEVVMNCNRQEKECFFSRIQADGRMVPDGELYSGDLTLELTLPVGHFIQNFAPVLSPSFQGYRSSDLLRIAASSKFGEKGAETSALVEWIDLKQSLQCGFQSDHLFPRSFDQIHGGWARSERLSHHFYGPCLALFSEDLEMYGDLDLIANYHDKRLEMALQVDGFILNHPLLDLRAEAIGEKQTTEGRVKFVHDRALGGWQVDLPLREGRSYHRETGLVFEGLDAQITLDSFPRALQADIRRGDLFFDGEELLKEAHCFFFLDEKGVSLREGVGTLAMGEEFSLQIPSLVLQKENSSCEVALLEKGQKVIHFAGEKKESWKGKLTHPFPFTDSLALDFTFDPIQRALDLKGSDAEGNPLVHLRKEESTFYLEQLKLGETTYLGKYTPSTGVHLKVASPQFTAALSGPLLVDFPVSGHLFALRSELSGSVSLQTPMPVTLDLQQPCKVAFSPEIGWIVSSLDLAGMDSKFELAHVEKIFEKNEIAVHQGHFQVSPALIGAAVQEKLLPEWFQELQLAGNLQGEVSLKTDPKGTNFSGTLSNLPFHGKITPEKNVALNLGDLNIKIEDDTLQSLHGTLGPLAVDLDKGKGEKMKGKLACNLAELDTLFAHPLSDQLKRMGLGNGLSLHGDFSLRKALSNWEFSGKLKGENFEWKGRTFRSLEAKMEVQPGNVTFERIDLTDEAGKLWISEGAITKIGGESPFWAFTFPLVEIRSFQPALFRHSEKPSSLTIKTASIQNVRGRMDDFSTVSGTGSCRFTNKRKKGAAYPFQGLPVQTLNRLNIEPEYLVPISGDVDFLVQSSRCYLQNLRGVQGERNQLDFLVPKGSSSGYLDFGGNLFVNIEVKKRGGRRETLPLSVRGTWDEPFLVLDNK